MIVLKGRNSATHIYFGLRDDEDPVPDVGLVLASAVDIAESEQIISIKRGLLAMPVHRVE